MKIEGATGEDLQKATQRRKRIAWLVASGLIVTVGFGLMVQKPWRLESLRKAAREAIQTGDYTGASLKARRALQIDPNYIPAYETMAEIGEHDGLPDAVVWRERVIHLKGECAETLLAFASTALSFGKISSARSALGRVPEKDHEREGFLVLAGTIALESGNHLESARLYETAARLNFELGECAVGGASDGNFAAALGVPVLDGLGVEGDGAHAAHEHILISDITRRAALLAGLVATL